MLNRREFLLASSGVVAAGRSLRAANPKLLTDRWPAQWVTVPEAPPKDYGVYHFRRSFDLPAKPGTFRLHVTGDMRYQLYVNGERVAWGPARSDLFHWRYETVDVAQWLTPGRNTLAAVVWNDGPFAALAQISNRTAFLVQGDGDAEQVANTGKGWICTQNAAYRPYPITPENRAGYWAVGPGEEIDAAAYPWGWEQPAFDDSIWRPVQVLSNGSPRSSSDGPNAWMLVPRPIPPMEESPDGGFEPRQAGSFPLTVAAGTTAKYVFDRTVLTAAFPQITVSGGRGAKITLKYVEGPRSAQRYGPKPRRDQIVGALLLGPEDIFTADGERRTYRPLFWRCYRYIEIKLETKDQSVTIEQLGATYTGYPFERKAKFEGGPADLQQILDVGWRTARLCAHETYMDTPYYEQLQYVGDTRIQAMVSIYNSGDHRLVRNAIEQIDASRTSEGATYSRAPSALQQYIPPFSLWWIGMVHDYWMYVDDPEFVRTMLHGARAVLGFYSRYQMADGRLGKMPWWNYIDWVEPPRWPNNTGPANPDGLSSVHELQLLLAYEWASQLEGALGEKMFADKYAAAAERLKETIRTAYWDDARGLFADTTDHKYWSQHANSLAVLAGVTSGDEARSVMEKTFSDTSLAQATIYFAYYVRLAMWKAGLGDRYLAMLDRPWRWALSYGFTTWPEMDSNRTRSDCHAWGASPNVELFRIVLGIDSAAPGFRRVSIRPHLAELREAAGSIPHEKGELNVRYRREGDQLHAEVTLPSGINGELVWAGKIVALRSGQNKLTL